MSDPYVFVDVLAPKPTCSYPRLPQCSSIKGLMVSILDGIWGLLKGSWGVLHEPGVEIKFGECDYVLS